MPETPQPLETKSLRAFWITFFLLNVGLVIGGSVGADRLEVSAGIAVPIVTAFLLQFSVYLVAVFPEARARLETLLSTKELAGCLVAVSVVPYLVYSLPTGVFSVESLVKLLAFCIAAVYLFVWFPPKGHRFQWQDVVVLLLLAYPMVGGASDMFQKIYRSPGGNVPEDVYALGKVMLIPLGAIIYLSLRRLEGANFQLRISARDFEVGVKNYLLFLPIGIPLTLGIGFAQWAPYESDSWSDPLAVLARIVGLYAVVSLAEELYFRGILQNLLSATWVGPRWGQFTASVLFGMAHISSRGFPNWRYALAAAFAGWFYGRAYNADRSVVAAAVTHTLVAGTHAFIFPPV
ncbi:MAG: CPBP family intramembrane metalloprotease [Bryobacterales bacterium]|nr:CPBP family intramembrane metalloprotease [Bryobacterales bacterium]